MMTRNLLSIILLAFLSSALSTHAKGHPESLKNQIASFVENKGQIHDPALQPLPQVRYQFASRGLNVSLTSNSIHYTFIQRIETEKTALKPTGQLALDTAAIYYNTEGIDVQLLHANPSAKITTEGITDFYQNFYLTGCGTNGIEKVHGYTKVIYHDIYPNIDWVVYTNPENPQSLKYDFVLRPGAKAKDIQLRCSGAGHFELKPDGNLWIKGSLGQIEEAKPYSFWEGDKQPVNSSFQLDSAGILHFKIDELVTRTLVIDPQLIWATYFGGNNDDGATNVTADDERNLYICGKTTSTSNLASFSAAQAVFGGYYDAFLAKFTPNGQALWATYLGGNYTESCYNVAFDTFRHIYVTGVTQSTSGLASSGAYQTSLGGGIDGFFARFTKSGTRVYSSYYGGSSNDAIQTLTIDNLGNFYVAGYTTSSNNIATTGSFKPSFSAVVDTMDGFFAKFDSSGNRLWGSYFGGISTDKIIGSAVDRSGNLLLTGFTTGVDNIATSGAFQSTSASPYSADAFLEKFSPSGSRIWGTYFGGKGEEYGMSLCTDPTNNIYLCGIQNQFSSISDLATSGAYQTTFGGRSDGFIAKFTTGGSRIWSTYYGGSDDDCWNGSLTPVPLTFDQNYQSPKWAITYGNKKLWLTGNTRSMDGIATPASYQDTLKGQFNAVIANFDTSGHRIWASYFGDSVATFDGGIYANDVGDVYVSGITQAPKNIATDSAYQTTLLGNSDAFFLRFLDSTSAIHLFNTHPYCMGDTFSLGYRITANGSQRNGNIFRAELSDAAGSFATPTIIGTRASRLSGMILCTLPTGITGTGYKVRVYASLPKLMSDTLTLTINAYPVPIITQTGSILSTNTFDTYQWYLNGVAISGAVNKSFNAKSNGNYTVKVSSGGCINTSATFNAGNLGLGQELNVSGIQLSPNPATNQIIIQGAPRGTSLRILNVMGQIVHSYILSQNPETISLDSFPSGVYTLEVALKNAGKKVFKILKQ